MLLEHNSTVRYWEGSWSNLKPTGCESTAPRALLGAEKNHCAYQMTQFSGRVRILRYLVTLPRPVEPFGALKLLHTGHSSRPKGNHPTVASWAEVR